ncbi:MAG: YtxH domain-containing protein [Bacteroidales bacterium]
MKKGNVAVGALAGLAIGGIAGILLAPKKGSTTRRQIADKSNDFMNELKSKFDEIHDSLAQKIENTKNDVGELADKGKSKFYEAKKDVKDAAENFKQNFGAADHSTS